MSSDDRVAVLTRAYRLFAARDIDGVLALLHEDVEWPDVARGTALHGKQEIRGYWRAQFAAVDPRVRPLGFAEVDGDVVVDVEQRVLDLGGRTLAGPTVVRHRYTFDGGLVRRMTVEPGPATTGR